MLLATVGGLITEAFGPTNEHRTRYLLSEDCVLLNHSAFIPKV